MEFTEEEEDAFSAICDAVRMGRKPEAEHYALAMPERCRAHVQAAVAAMSTSALDKIHDCIQNKQHLPPLEPSPGKKGSRSPTKQRRQQRELRREVSPSPIAVVSAVVEQGNELRELQAQLDVAQQGAKQALRAAAREKELREKAERSRDRAFKTRERAKADMERTEDRLQQLRREQRAPGGSREAMKRFTLRLPVWLYEKAAEQAGTVTATTREALVKHLFSGEQSDLIKSVDELRQEVHLLRTTRAT